MPCRGLSAALCAALVLAGSGCSCGGESPAADAGASDGDGPRPSDASIGPDAAAPLIWIDFSITGCDSGSGGEPGGDGPPGGGADAGAEEPCRGAAPLVLQFVPVAPAPVDLYEWSFGDGSEPDRTAAPVHVYSAPGVYDVTLSAQGPGGTASAVKAGVVVVGPGGAGAACEEAAQCAGGDCRCAGGACPGVPSGFCTAPCSAAAPCESGVCADLAAGGPADPEAWQARVCLPSCEDGAPCPAGMICRELPRGDGDGWLAACFHPGLLGDIGDSCADAGGALRDDLCASGHCLALGQRGLCSAPCGEVACPASAACATFEGGAPVPSCLARCGAGGAACDADPGLACEAPGGAGALSFTVDEPPAEDGYCAPRTCESPGDCGSLGLCVDGTCSFE